MAGSRTFNGSSQNFTYSGAWCTSYPCTIFGWVWHDVLPTVDGDEHLYCTQRKTSDDFVTLRGDDTSNQLQLNLRQGAGGVSVCSSVNTLTANAWQSVAGIMTSATDRTCVLQGDWANRGTTTTNVSWPASDDMTAVTVGRWPVGADWMNGRIGLIAVWHAALVQGEIKALHNGVSPYRIRPNDIAYLYSFAKEGTGDSEPNLVAGSATLSPVGNPGIEDGPPMEPLYAPLLTKQFFFEVTATGAYTLTADAGAYGLAGEAANLIKASVLEADADVYSLTGETAGLIKASVVTAEPSVLNLTGQDAQLIYTPVSQIILPADAGAYTLSGEAANLIAASRVIGEAGLLTIDGQDAGLNLGVRLSAEAGAIALTGQDVNFRLGTAVSAEPGAYIITGEPADLLYDGVIPVTGYPWKSYMQGRLQDREIRKFVDFGVTNLSFSAFGGLGMNAPPSSLYTLGAGWTKFTDFDKSVFSAPRGVTVDIPNSSLSIEAQATYIAVIYFIMSHDESQQGRRTNIRIFNETEQAAVGTVPIAIARNQPGTNFTILPAFPVTPSGEGDVLSIELGGGDSVTGTFDAFSFYVYSISPTREQIVPM